MCSNAVPLLPRLEQAVWLMPDWRIPIHYSLKTRHDPPPWLPVPFFTWL